MKKTETKPEMKDKPKIIFLKNENKNEKKITEKNVKYLKQ